MGQPRVINSQDLLKELVKSISMDAKSPDDAVRIADELLGFLSTKLRQVDWTAAIRQHASPKASPGWIRPISPIRNFDDET